MAFPVSLRVCEGVLESLPGARAAAAAAGSRVGWALDAGGGCGVLSSCAKRQQWTYPKATCLVRLASDV